MWKDVIASLDDSLNTVRYDLPGFGSRASTVSDPSALSLQTLADEAAEILAGISTRVIVVGQSLGSQVAELVAARHADRVDGLVLVTPVPLGGTRLPDDAAAPFRALAGDAAAQRAARSVVSPALTAQQLEVLSTAGTAARPDVVTRYVDLWNDGIQDAPATSDYTGPVLVISGGADQFANKAVTDTVVTRFPHARQQVIEGGGHWLHVEFPEAVANLLLEFADTVTRGTTTGGWRRGFADQSAAAFANELADDVVFEASTLARQIEGKQRVAEVLATASSIYESLEFTAEAHNGSTTYLQWRTTAFGGMQMKGVTVLERDAHGKVVAVAIHRRPLDAVLRFSSEMRDRLTDVIPAEHFLKETR